MENFKKYNLTQTAEIFNIKDMGRSRIYKILRLQHIVDENRKPYQKFIDEGFFDFGLPKVRIPGYTFKVPVTLVVDEKGLDFVKKVIKNYLNEKGQPKIHRRNSKKITFDGDNINIENAFGE